MAVGCGRRNSSLCADLGWGKVLAMSDLMKLTPKELRALSPEQLLRWLLVFQGGNWYDETRRRLERLEQCEASIRELLCWFGPGSAASLGAKCETLQEALDAARAAMEEK